MSSVFPSNGGTLLQRCLRCGAPLPSNTITCANCGTYNPVVHPGTFSNQQVQWTGLQSQSSLNGGQYSGIPLEQPPVSTSQFNQWGQPYYMPQNNANSASYVPQSSSSFNNSYPIPGQSPQSHFNNFYVAPQQNAYYSSSLNTYGGSIRPLPQKRRSWVSLIVGIVLLLALIAGGVLTGYYFYRHRSQNSTSLSTKSSIIVTPTAVPLFSDTFASDNMGWDLTSNPGKFSVKVGRGSLVLEDNQNKLLWELVPGKIFTDFRLDVNAVLTKGDQNNGYGVFIRASNQGTDLGTYYRFELYGDGTYAIFKGYLDTTGTTQSMNVHGYVVHPAIAKAGQVNHITILAKGTSMSLIVNGQTVYTYSDESYKGGSIALFVSNLPKLTPGAQATFTNLAIFPPSR